MYYVSRSQQHDKNLGPILAISLLFTPPPFFFNLLGSFPVCHLCSASLPQLQSSVFWAMATQSLLPEYSCQVNSIKGNADLVICPH